jgi:hypothetical protein
MSQYNSRIFIKVKDVEDWKKLSDIDFKNFGFLANPFDGNDKESFEIDGDWSCYEGELEDFVYAIDSKIHDCLIFADTTNINVDPYAFIAYKIGEDVNCDEIEGDFQWETSIDDPFGWFEIAGIKLSDKKIEILKDFGFDE